jgi:hypothetical protein
VPRRSALPEDAGTTRLKEKTMNLRTRTIVTAVALAAFGSAQYSRAGLQEDFLEQQRLISDGYYPQAAVQARPSATKPATAHQLAENRWLELERARGSGNVSPVPFPPSDTPLAPKSSRESSRREIGAASVRLP